MYRTIKYGFVAIVKGVPRQQRIQLMLNEGPGMCCVRRDRRRQDVRFLQNLGGGGFGVLGGNNNTNQQNIDNVEVRIV